jgi:FtsP/CotA-like multicopper oxidase with cupredoxin domain
MAQLHTHEGTFGTDASGLPPCQPTELVELADGDTFELRIGPVANQIGDRHVRMVAFNGSIPGPTLRVRQGTGITVRVRNDADGDTTVHWHGLRLDNRYDGVPHDTQAPIPAGGAFTYRLHFPDDGLYWYHPHVREDYGLEMGLYGNILVDPVGADTWEPVDQEAIVTLDDVLVDDVGITPFRVDGPTHTAMGRFGNTMFTAGRADLRLDAGAGEVVRFFLTNTANTRIFNLAIPGARMKLVGGDSGRVEREQWVQSVLLSPSERAIVDVRFESPGTFPLEHHTPDRRYHLGSVVVTGRPSGSTSTDEFERLHRNDELAGQRAQVDADLARPADKTLVLTALMPLLYGDEQTNAGAWTCPMHPEVVSSERGICPKCGMQLIPSDAGAAPMPAMDHGSPHAHGSGDGLEWEDLMPEINARTDESNMIWKLVDEATGLENGGIDWSFRVGDRVKIRLVNTMDSEHPMHHPFHIHGAGRFLVLSRDGEAEPNLVWKDTVLVRAGETVDIVLDVTNPGLWMAHCHIAEHNQDGMMFSFRVAEP